MACLLGKGGTLSCRCFSSRAMSSGSKTGRVDRIYPNLMKIGPRASSAKRKRSPRLSLALEALGPIFIKFGQILSTRPDLLPEDIALEAVSRDGSIESVQT